MMNFCCLARASTSRLCREESTNKFCCCLVYIITKVLMNFWKNVLPSLVPQVSIKFRNRVGSFG
jgi:hypothetical protein